MTALPAPRPARAAGLAALLAVSAPALAQDAPATPNEADVPRPVPTEATLAGAERPDVSRFLNVRSARSPSLSPDGRRLAFSTQISGEPQLWVVDAEGGWPRQLTFGEPVTFHRWSPDGGHVLYGVDRGGNEREGFYLVTPDGLEERELLPPSDAFRTFGAFTRDGQRVVYATTERTGTDFDIHLLDVATGESREVFRGRMGLYARSFSPDGGAVLLTEARGEDANDLFLFSVEAGRLDTLFSPPDRSRYESFAWTPDGRGFYLATDHGRDYAALAFYDVAARDLRFVETPDRDVDQVTLSADGRYLAWTTNDEGYSGLYVRDLQTGRAVPAPPLPRGIYRLDWADRVPVVAVSVTGPSVPGDVWTWDLEADALYRATESASAGLDLAAMVVPEPHTFTARDGVTVHGLLYRPKPSDEAPPVLLAVHGGPTAQARPDFDGPLQYLVSRGVAVFDLNFRGSTGYGKAYARLNDGRLRENELGDLADALGYLAGQGVDTSRAAVMGGSYGGYLTMAALARLPEHFDAGVAFVGVSDWLTALEGASPQLKASDRVEYGDIDSPEDRAFFRQISPITHVDGVRAPVMVLHGANDPRDPVTESDQFVDAIRQRGGPVEYLRFPDEGHGIRQLSNRLIAYRRIADFLETHLGLDGPAGGRP